MSRIQYIGKSTPFVGRSLPQLCLRLKNFGIGRLFKRHSVANQYSEGVSYYVLKKIEIDMKDPYMRKGIFHADAVLKGIRIGSQAIPGDFEDFQLIPKDDEQMYLSKTLKSEQIQKVTIPKFVDLPPLFKVMLENDAKQRNLNVNLNDLKLPLIIKDSIFKNVVQE